MQRQSTQAFCGLAIDYYTEMYTGAPNRGHYPFFATFDIAGYSRSIHVEDLKKPIVKTGEKPLKIAFHRDGLKLTNAMMLHVYGASCCIVSAKQAILLYISSKPLHTQSHTLMKS